MQWCLVADLGVAAVRVVTVHERSDSDTEFIEVCECVPVEKFVLENTPKRFRGCVVIRTPGGTHGSLESRGVALGHDVSGIKLSAPVGMKHSSLGVFSRE